MAAPLRQPLAPEVVLGREGEEEWQRFRRQLELHEGFWLGFLFTDAFTVSRAFRTRTEALLRLRARHLLHLAPASPQELEATVASLFDADIQAANLVWVEPSWGDRRTPKIDEAWNRAWDRFFLRLNERRDRLRDTFHGALLIVAPRPVKSRVREAAPDLWSIRAMVCEVVGSQPQPYLGAHRAVTDLELGREHEPARLQVPPHSAGAVAGLPPKAVTLLRRAEGHLASGRPERAIPDAAEAVDLLERHDLPINEALWTLARAEGESGDHAAALEHAEFLVQRLESRDVAALYRLIFLAYLLDQSEHPERAEAAWREALNLAGELEAQEDGSAAGRRLVGILDRLGDAIKRRGRTRDAVAAYEQSLVVAQRLIAEHGESPQRLRYVSVSLNKLGAALLEQSDVNGARRAFETSLELGRRLLTEHGESPEHLLTVSVSLEMLGEVLQQQGDEAAGRRCYEESLEMRRRVLSEHGERPDRLRHVSVSLERLGDVLLRQGDEAGARRSCEESLEIRRRLLTEHGESGERLRDLSVSLEGLGDALLQQGDDTGARRAYEESLEIRRRLLTEHGESSERLRDVSLILQRLGVVLRQEGDEAGGRRSYFEESLEISRRLLTEYGENQKHLTDVAYALAKLAYLDVATGDATTAHERLTEVGEIFRRLIELYGETDPRRRDLALVENILEGFVQSPGEEAAGNRSTTDFDSHE